MQFESFRIPQNRQNTKIEGLNIALKRLRRFQSPQNQYNS